MPVPQASFRQFAPSGGAWAPIGGGTPLPQYGAGNQPSTGLSSLLGGGTNKLTVPGAVANQPGGGTNPLNLQSLGINLPNLSGGNLSSILGMIPGAFSGQGTPGPGGTTNLATGGQQATGGGTGTPAPPNASNQAANAMWGELQQYLLDPAQQVLQAQTGNLQSQNTLTQQQLADQGQYQSQSAQQALAQLGIQGKDIDLSKQYLTEQYGPGGTAGQQSALTSAEQQYQTGEAQRALRSQATASGSINTQGTKQSWSDILANQGFEQQQGQLTTKEQQQSYANSSAQLDNASSALGISKEQVTSQLDNALSQLGLQGKLDSLQVLQGVSQLQQGFLSGPWAQAVSAVLSQAGIPIQALMYTTPLTPAQQAATNSGMQGINPALNNPQNVGPSAFGALGGYTPQAASQLGV